MAKEKKSLIVIHGPNLSRLGIREPSIYGTESLDEINAALNELASQKGWRISCMQSNHEGVIVDTLEEADGQNNAVILNAAGLTHTSVVLRDTIAALSIPVIEVHLSNIFAREEFRQQSLISPVCKGVVSGFGKASYLMALWYIINHY